MSSENNAPIAELLDYAEKVDERLVAAGQMLRKIAEYENMDVDSVKEALMAAIEEYQAAGPEVEALENVFLQWSESELSVYQRSEVTRSLGQLKRLKLVSKNIQRVAKKILGIPDPEGMQEQMQYMAMNMGALHK